MARDGVVNVVVRLQELGFDPRRVGSDAWEARCPAHCSADHALAITRNEFNQVVFECRSSQNCQHFRILGALGITNDHLYAETPDFLVARLGRAPIQPSSLEGAGASVVALTERADTEVRGTENGGRRTEGVVALTERGDTEEPGVGQDAACGPSSAVLPPHPIVERVTSGADCPAAPASAVFSPEACAEVAAAVGPAQGPSPAAVAQPPERMLNDMIALATSSPSGRLLAAVNGGGVERPSVVQLLSRIASTARLFRSANGRYCAQVPVGERLEIFGLRSAAFRDWLIDVYLTEQEEAPSNWAIHRVIGTLEARARFRAGIPEVFVRVGQDIDKAEGGSTYFLDLGDATGRAVAIRHDGWSVVYRPGAHFRRPDGLLALPEPERNGSVELLRKYVNLTEPDFRLMIAWLTAALRPVGPYPILVLNGDQDSGKSTLAKILRLLIDPQTCPSLALPHGTDHLMATAVNGWLMVYENITTIGGWLSDCLCQLAFGGGYASRALFTNDERSVIYAQRPVILVGIDDFVKRGDLRDRSVFLNLAPIRRKGRRSERSFWPAFQADYPRILGGVLDAVAGGLRELPSVHLDELPRMADYAEWGEAVGRSLGWGAGTFLWTYDENRRRATDPLLDNSMVAQVILVFTAKAFTWSGTTQKLYQTLTEALEPKYKAYWPRDFSTFGAELRRIAPQLAVHGITVSYERKRDRRIVTLTVEKMKMADGQPETAGP